MLDVARQEHKRSRPSDMRLVTASERDFSLNDPKGLVFGGLEGFFKEMGEPGTIDEVPAQSSPDIPKLLALGAKYQCEHPTLRPQT